MLSTEDEGKFNHIVTDPHHITVRLLSVKITVHVHVTTVSDLDPTSRPTLYQQGTYLYITISHGTLFKHIC